MKTQRRTHTLTYINTPDIDKGVNDKNTQNTWEKTTF